jgi:hypothetical protein
MKMGDLLKIKAGLVSHTAQTSPIVPYYFMMITQLEPQPLHHSSVVSSVPQGVVEEARNLLATIRPR